MDQARLQLFDEALQALLTTLQPSQESDAARRLVVADMQQLVSQALPPDLHCSVETFGSFRAGLHLPGSDLDFALSGWVDSADGTRQIELHEWSNNEQQYLLQDLADALEKEKLVQGQVERVLHARVPVIKFVHSLTGLSCDFSIHRPECGFKADMQKLLGSLDRRYATLYRLVKAWAAAHGLNDAAANTLNSWSLGLMVALFLQSESPAVLPPIWQLLDQQPPNPREPRILQLPGVNSAMLKRVLNHAAAGAGAYIGRKARAGPEALNNKSIGELLAGFFAFYAPRLTDWVGGRASSCRASTWWGMWVDAAWVPSKQYIFSIEDPFHAGDNTARSVGTQNHLSSCNTACYIAATTAATADHLWRALHSTQGDGTSKPASAAAACSSEQQQAQEQHTSHEDMQPQELQGRVANTAAGDSSAAGGCDAEAVRDILAAFAWLFGPQAVLQLKGLPAALTAQLSVCIPEQLLVQLRRDLEPLEDCAGALACSSSLVNTYNNSSGLDAVKVQQVEAALRVYKELMHCVGCSQHDVCLGDYMQRKRRVEKQQQEERERERQQWLQQQQQWQRQRNHQVLAAMQGLNLGHQQQHYPQPPPTQQQQQAAVAHVSMRSVASPALQSAESSEGSIGEVGSHAISAASGSTAAAAAAAASVAASAAVRALPSQQLHQPLSQAGEAAAAATHGFVSRGPAASAAGRIAASAFAGITGDAARPRRTGPGSSNTSWQQGHPARRADRTLSTGSLRSSNVSGSASQELLFGTSSGSSNSSQGLVRGGANGAHGSSSLLESSSSSWDHQPEMPSRLRHRLHKPAEEQQQQRAGKGRRSQHRDGDSKGGAYQPQSPTTVVA